MSSFSCNRTRGKNISQGSVMTPRILVILCLSIGLAFTAMPAAAQSKKEKAEEAKVRPVEGVVTNAADQPVEGAVVQMKNLKSLQVRSFITKDDGRFIFRGLDINTDYELKADGKGGTAAAKRLSVFDDRRKPVINFKLEPAAK